MTLRALLGIDIGTSSVKVAAFSASGHELIIRRAETPTTRLPGGQAEHDVNLLWTVVAGLIRSAVDALEGHRVEAVAVASVGEAGVPLDDQGIPVRHAIAWFDSRGKSEADWWSREAGADRVYRITGQPIDSYYSVNKLLWLRRNEPDAFRRTRHWLSLADLLIHRLSGSYATDFTLASRSMCFDQERLAWSDDLLGFAGLDRSLFPEAYPSGTVVGFVTSEAAARTGLLQGTPIVTGGHDRLCAAFAARGSEALAVDSTGSAEAVVMPTPRYTDRGAEESGAVACYADVVPGQYVFSARVGYATALTDWYSHEVQGSTSITDIDQEIPWPLKFSGLICYPSFGRVLAPAWDSRASHGAIFGLTLGHTGSDILQALVESVGYSLRANLEWLEQLLGQVVSTVRVEGSLTLSRVWMQLKADVTGRRMEGTDLREATSLGAALLAGVGAGIYVDHMAAAQVVDRNLKSWEPTHPLSATYERIYREAFGHMAECIARIAPSLQRNNRDTPSG